MLFYWKANTKCIVASCFNSVPNPQPTWWIGCIDHEEPIGTRFLSKGWEFLNVKINLWRIPEKKRAHLINYALYAVDRSSKCHTISVWTANVVNMQWGKMHPLILIFGFRHRSLIQWSMTSRAPKSSILAGKIRAERRLRIMRAHYFSWSEHNRWRYLNITLSWN